METPEITKFCLDTIDTIRTKVNESEPKDNFMLLAMLENFISKIRHEVADEWTYCAGCNQYVKKSERKRVDLSDGRYTIVCGTCGGVHRVLGISSN